MREDYSRERKNKEKVYLEKQQQHNIRKDCVELNFSINAHLPISSML